MREYFNQFNTIVVLGASSDPYRTSYHIAEYMQQNGYRVVPVNPNEEEVLGEKSYPTLADLPADIGVDAVVIFRNKIYTEEMVRQIIDWTVQRGGEKPVIWTQLDVSSREARELAVRAGFPYVENRCMMVEHRSVP